MISLKVNGKTHQVDVDPGTPLLWVLRDTLGIRSVKYACGISECGICTVLMDGSAQRSCVVDVADAAGVEITTVEGLPENHPVKEAWTAAQVPQCGYCQPGMMLQAADFLSGTPHPSGGQIDAAMDGMLCRCGTHPRIKKAMVLAAKMMEKQGG